MLDRRYIRENRDEIVRAVRLKNESVDIAGYYAKDAERRAALQEMETLQAEANRANKEIAERKKSGEDASGAIESMKQVAARLKQLKARASELDGEVDELYLRIPNVPDPEVPEGGEENHGHAHADAHLVPMLGPPGDDLLQPAGELVLLDLAPQLPLHLALRSSSSVWRAWEDSNPQPRA